jgi:hypothetical protein
MSLPIKGAKQGSKRRNERFEGGLNSRSRGRAYPWK